METLKTTFAKELYQSRDGTRRSPFPEIPEIFSLPIKSVTPRLLEDLDFLDFLPFISKIISIKR